MTGATASPTGAASSVTRLVAWVLLLVGSHLGLTAAATMLPTPPAPWHLDAIRTWIEATDIVAASFAILRVGALALTWYLAAITVLALVARLSGSHPLAAFTRAVSLPFARRLLRHVLGAGLTVSLAGGLVPMAGGLSAAGAQPTPVTSGPVVTMRAADGPAPAGGPSVSMRALPDPAPASAGAPKPSAPILTMHAVGETTDPGATWTAVAGDHLWHIAAATLESAWSRPASDDEVTGYWRTLVAANESRLAIPGDADVVYPGQVFVLPATPPAPAG